MGDLGLSLKFIEYCKNQVGKSPRYLLEEARHGGVYVREWGLVVPEGLLALDEHTDQFIRLWVYRESQVTRAQLIFINKYIDK